MNDNHCIRLYTRSVEESTENTGFFDVLVLRQTAVDLDQETAQRAPQSLKSWG